MTGNILYAVSGGIARLVLNHPGRLNALSLPMWQALPELVEQAIAGPTLEGLLAPVQADFARSGMTEDQLLDLGRDLLDQVRAEKKD